MYCIRNAARFFCAATEPEIAVADRIVDFGKYRGQAMGSLPAGYLHWIRKNLIEPDRIKWSQWAQEILAMRALESQDSDKTADESVIPENVSAAECIIPFGLHKGQKMESLPSGYLHWIVKRFVREAKIKWSVRAEEVLISRGVVPMHDGLDHTPRKGILDRRTDIPADAEQDMQKPFESIGQMHRTLKMQQKLLDSSEPHLEASPMRTFESKSQILKKAKPEQRSLELELQKHSPDYVSIIKRCIASKSLADGQLVHAYMLDSGIAEKRYFANFLIQMYGKCDCLERAKMVFDTMPSRNAYTFGIMIAAYVQHGKPMEALEVYQEMESEGVLADGFVLASVIDACASLQALDEGKAIHKHMVAIGFNLDDVLRNALLDMYCKCGSFEDARQVFDEIKQKDVLCWSMMILAYAQHGHFVEALQLFRKMDLEGVSPSCVTLTTIVKVCGKLVNVKDGKAVHARAVSCGFERETKLLNALVDMYVRFGDTNKAIELSEKIDGVCQSTESVILPEESHVAQMDVMASERVLVG